MLVASACADTARDQADVSRAVHKAGHVITPVFSPTSRMHSPPHQRTMASSGARMPEQREWGIHIGNGETCVAY